MTNAIAPYGYTTAGRPRKHPPSWVIKSVEIIAVPIPQDEYRERLSRVAEILYEFCRTQRAGVRVDVRPSESTPYAGLCGEP